MNESQLQMVKEEIEKIESQGHGEVTIKIKNGYVWRVLSTKDNLIDLTEHKKGANN